MATYCLFCELWRQGRGGPELASCCQLQAHLEANLSRRDTEEHNGPSLDRWVLIGFFSSGRRPTDSVT